MTSLLIQLYNLNTEVYSTTSLLIQLYNLNTEVYSTISLLIQLYNLNTEVYSTTSQLIQLQFNMIPNCYSKCTFKDFFKHTVCSSYRIHIECVKEV